MGGGLNKAFAIAIAIQFQIVGIVATGWLIGSWLNKEYPKNFNWYYITFSIAVIAVIQTLIKMYFYVRKRL
jgi:hypothetical protein